MKKIFISLFTITLAFLFTACGEMDTPITSNDGGQTSSLTDSTVLDSMPSASNSSNENEKISEDRAKEIALKHAGLKEENITAYRIELDRDDPILSYEIEFNSDGFEYDYDINAENGNIIKSEKERID